jgi:hypothetical protein
VYGNAYKPGRPGLNETIGKIVNKALGRLDDQTRMVDWGHASQLWDSLPTNMLKDIYGPNYAAMDLTMSQLAPVFVAANAKLKAAPSSAISHLRSITSLAQYGKVILGGVTGGLTAGPVGALALPVFMVAIAKAPNILFNRLINKGTTTQYTKSMGASIGQKEREYERTNNK